MPAISIVYPVIGEEISFTYRGRTSYVIDGTVKGIYLKDDGELRITVKFGNGSERSYFWSQMDNVVGDEQIYGSS